MPSDRSVEVAPRRDLERLRRLRFRYAVATLAGVGAIILLGAQVTTTRAGDSVPTWPASFFVPADRHQWFELGHRWVAGTVGAMTVVLTLLCFGYGTARSVRRLGVWCAVAVVAQALLGGARVLLKEEHPNSVSIAHTMLGQTYLALMTALTLRLSPKGASAPGAIGSGALAPSILASRGRVLVGVVWGQALLGAIQRHMIEGRNWGGVGVHVLGALVVLWAAFRVVEPALHEGETSPRYRRVALWIGGLLGLQILLGLFAVVVTRGDGGYVNAQDATSLIPTLHTLNGAAILALAVAAAIVANEDVETPAART